MKRYLVMTSLLGMYRQIATGLNRFADEALPFAARLVFAAVLLFYFWNSGLTKIGDSLFSPSVGAYAQIFPRAFEALGYDSSQVALWQKLFVITGTLAEFALPALIVIGLFTRLSALGMVGFVALQSLTDVYGHNAGEETIGAWFDNLSDAAILDQRALWILLLLILIGKGAGRISLDRLLESRLR
jgi:putative oxidoreductase